MWPAQGGNEHPSERPRTYVSEGAQVPRQGWPIPEPSVLAERVGFEPTVLSHTAFRERHHQPLGHLSGARIPKAFGARGRGERPCPRPARGCDSRRMTTPPAIARHTIRPALEPPRDPQGSPLRRVGLVSQPLLNKGTSFSEHER